MQSAPMHIHEQFALAVIMLAGQEYFLRDRQVPCSVGRVQLVWIWVWMVVVILLQCFMRTRGVPLGACCVKVWFLDDWHERINASVRFLLYHHPGGQSLQRDFTTLSAAVEAFGWHSLSCMSI